jgi:hypothetical protein
MNLIRSRAFYAIRFASVEPTKNVVEDGPVPTTSDSEMKQKRIESLEARLLSYEKKDKSKCISFGSFLWSPLI